MEMQAWVTSVTIFFKLATLDDEDFLIRKRKKPKKEKQEGLKLILKVGNNSATSTPERGISTTSDGSYEPLNSPVPIQFDSFSRAHKKSKKKKKKKEKDYDKREKKKLRKLEKKKRYKDSSHVDIHSGTASSRIPQIALNFTLATDKRESTIPKTKSEKNAFIILLENLHQLIESRDIQKFFAWPVTDQIAPGYSSVISQPMDMNTMKRNIENNVYKCLSQYFNDLKLMCKNAMIYNRPETVYFKAAKKLLHFGSKLEDVENLRSIPALLPLLNEIAPEVLGCVQDSSTAQSENEEGVKTEPLCPVEDNVDIKPAPKVEDTVLIDTVMSVDEVEFDSKAEDELAKSILQQATNAAKQVAEKVAQKKPASEMGFLRQNKDGTTTLAILIPSSGIDGKTKERPISLGSLIGKLSHGSGSLQGFREDKRNFMKTVKPLYYGAFGSYAPSYDSTFANLTKDESHLLFQTYGDEAAVHYAESILNFAKDCDYVTTMVDNLLDIMTGGDHRKTKKLLEEKKKLKDDEEMGEQCRKNMMDTNTSSVMPLLNTTNVTAPSSIIKSATVSPVNFNILKNTTAEEEIDLNTLKTLSDLGIDTSFVNYFEHQQKEDQKINEKLEQTRSLLERLQQTQYERLSAPLPAHLSHIQSIGEAEHQLAEKVTESLTNIIKKVPPGNVAPVAGVRKAMGIAPVPPQQQIQNNFFSQMSNNNFPMSTGVDEPVNSNMDCTFSSGSRSVSQNSKPTDPEQPSSNQNLGVPSVTGFDFESELREFLESDSALSSFQLPEDADDADNTIEQMLSAHS